MPLSVGSVIPGSSSNSADPLFESSLSKSRLSFRDGSRATSLSLVELDFFPRGPCWISLTSLSLSLRGTSLTSLSVLANRTSLSESLIRLEGFTSLTSLSESAFSLGLTSLTSLSLSGFSRGPESPISLTSLSDWPGTKTGSSPLLPVSPPFRSSSMTRRTSLSDDDPRPLRMTVAWRPRASSSSSSS